LKSTTALAIAAALGLSTACGGQEPAPQTAPTANQPTNARPAAPAQTLTAAEAPASVKEQMAQRGEQDRAEPVLKIVEPKDGATITSSTVPLKLDLGGDLKGYAPHKDPATGKGNHIHVILDNQPYEAYYELGKPFELRNVADGKHTVRVFASRPWHESYKNEGSFQMVEFTVQGGGADAAKPATAPGGQPMSNTNAAAGEGKAYEPSQGGPVDRTKPLLTYSRPKGEYAQAEADPIMIDFWLTNAKLRGDGGEYRVRYSVDDGEPKFVDTWAPVWLSGWAAGKHTVKLDLVDGSGNLVDNGGYNSTTRQISVVK
jgi:hypothetical protein